MARTLPVPTEGQRCEVVYPFIFDKTPSGYEECGAPYDEGRWKPGVVWELVVPDDSEAVANGVGKQILTVVSVHKPGRFQTRVFYTQAWIDPDGRTFGKNACRVMTLEKFRRRSRGYAIPFVLREA
jgi:hypothetical protein